MSDTLFCLDLETTGLDPATAGIVEIGCVAIRDGAILAEWSALCWPGLDRINRSEHHDVLERTSGISPALVMDAPEAADVVFALRDWALSLSPVLPIPVTSYNAPFDRAFLEAALPVYCWDWRECIMARCRNALGSPYRGSYGPALWWACQHLGIHQNGAHRALEDARCAAQVWLALEGRGR